MIKNKLLFISIFVIISLILFNVVIILPCTKKKIYITKKIKSGICVPPAPNSHPKCCPQAGRLKYPNTWNNLPHDNNIPGLLPGPRPGEQLGLHNILDLSSPIRAPLLNSHCVKQKIHDKK